MAGGDKRAKLLSDLLAAKGGASALPAEPEHASVIQIADRRPNEDRTSETTAAPSVLYSKGAATASSFRPSYWSFDHDQQAEPTVESARVEPVPPAPIAPAVHIHKSKPLPVNFVIGFGCLALVVSTSLFVLSVWHRAELPAARPEPAPIAVASAPAAPMIVLPSPPPAQSIAAPPAPAPALAALAPADPTPAPAPPPVALAPAAAPPVSAPAPVTIDPPPAPAIATPIAEAPIEPAPVAASTPASSPKPPADAQQAAALLARGDDLLATGDVTAARLFYQRAAEQGSASAATAVGQTYDPAVLELLRVRGARGDVQMAAEWYRKAIAAGDRQAEIRLKRLLARTPG
jgi:hypothetical protein